MDDPGLPRILIVEDNPANRKLAEIILMNAGYRTLTAQDGLQGLAEARRLRPELILLDIQLPGLDGLTIARLLKSDPETRAIPIIAMTSLAMKGDEERILTSGCDAYLSKPVGRALLLESLSRLIPKGTADG